MKTWLGSIIVLGLFSAPTQATELIHEKFARAPIVFIGLATRAGSASDPAGKSGLVNLTGDMLLRGTASKSKAEIDRALDRMGARLEVQTQLDSLTLTGAVLKSQLPEFLELLCEILERPTFPTAELTKLQKETESLIVETTADDYQLLKRRFRRFLFGSHPYGLPSDGRLPELRKLTVSDIRGIHPRLFRPDAMLLGVTGDATAAEAAQIQARIDRALASFKSASPLPIPEPAKPADTPRLLIVNKPGRTQAQIMIGRIAWSLLEADTPAFQVANHAIGGGIFGSRLIREIRVNRGWSYTPGSRLLISRQPNAWFMTYAPALKDALVSIAYVRDLVESFKKTGLETDEFNLARQNLIQSSAFTANTPAKRLQNAINEKVLDLPAGFFAQQAKRTEPITLPKSNEALARFLAQAPLTWVIVGPANQLRAPVEKALGLKPGSAEVRSYSDDF